MDEDSTADDVFCFKYNILFMFISPFFQQPRVKILNQRMTPTEMLPARKTLKICPTESH